MKKYLEPEFIEFLQSTNLVMTKQVNFHGEYLLMFKYKRNVFHDNLWHVSPWLLRCRGLITTHDYEVVLDPFDKIFNYSVEAQAPHFSDDELVRCSKKINGFLASTAMRNGKLLVATQGSINGEHVVLARKHLEPVYAKHLHAEGVTMMYEVCDADDPHIIEEAPGAYPIAYRYHMTRHIQPMPYDIRTFGEVKADARTCEHEGFVVYSQDNTRVTKIKSPHYLVKKFLARATQDVRIIEGRDRIPEEYYPLHDHVKKNISEFMQLDEQSRLKFMVEYLLTYP